MADLENDDDLENSEDNEDNLENEDSKKYDDKFKYYDYDNNEMYTMYLKNSKIDNVKIDKISDYYNLFVGMLKSEPEDLHTREHLWILGINEDNYSVCLYVVTIGYPNFFNIEPAKLFKIALLQNSVTNNNLPK